MANISTTRATEQTLTQVLTALQNLTGAVQNISGQFDSDDVTITSPTDFPDAAANIKLQSVIDEIQNVVNELQGTLSVTFGGAISVSNFPAEFPDQHDQPLTDTQLRAADVEVNDSAAQTILNTLGTEATLQSIETDLEAILTQLDDATADTIMSVLKEVLTELQGTLDVATGLQQPLTDTQLRASDVEVNDDAAQTILAEMRDDGVPVKNRPDRSTFGEQASVGHFHEVAARFSRPISTEPVTTEVTGDGAVTQPASTPSRRFLIGRDMRLVR